MKWLADYGTFIAASLAAAISLWNSRASARREVSSRHAEWLRETRITRYVALLAAARTFREQTERTYGTYEDVDITPAGEPDLASATADFEQQLNEVQLVGPTSVGEAAVQLKYAVWEFRRELERDPSIRDVTPISVPSAV
jgi:hypothetical protein